jgi:Mce-associated membrane protein
VLAAALLAVVTDRLSHHLSDDGGNSFTTTAAPIVSSAQTELTAALSYDYQTLPQDFARAEKGLTPSFRKNYERTTATAVSGVAKKYKAVTTATIGAIGVITVDDDQATLLAYVNATSKNSNLSAARLDRERVQVQMRKVDGRWLIDGLTTL